MDQLPSSIEAYLEEAGFSGTEILILRRLMDGEPLTIRQLGAKTGKSTGVLDAAMKKLIKKNIIKKTLINDAPKYSLDSLDAVVEWMQDDMEQKRDLLLRRHQNFESFVTSLESGTKRPDIEYFEGESGIKQAYIKLLNGPGEIFHYLPVTGKEEEDPLRDFRVQYFRERQHRKMFSRILAHNNPLGRRYQSRDAFEYRKTVLVSETEYPFTFEKIITGDRIACFDHKAKTACVIRYPELADIEKTLFEAIWRQVQLSANAPKEEVQKALSETRSEKIAMSTETLSKVREFFLSPRSLIAFGMCALLAFATTYLLYQQNVDLNKQRIQERVKSIAATAALQFDANDINQIWTIDDIGKPEYAKLIHHLNRIRRENEGLKYAYIMRPADEKGMWQFVVDADALEPFVERDVDGDGTITEVDHLPPPGEIYREPEQDEDQFFTLEKPMAYEPASDQWGTVIAGSAPILNKQGEPIALIGVDIESDQLYDLASASFWPAASFFGFFVLFLILRFAAFNQAFIREYMSLVKVRSGLIFIAAGFIASIVCSGWIYSSGVTQRIEFIRNRILTIATTGSLQFSEEELNQLHSLKDTERPVYKEVLRKLEDIRQKNGSIKYAYLIRPLPSTTFEFIADADAFSRDLFTEKDMDGNGVIDLSDETPYPGLSYDISHIEILRERRYFTSIVTPKPYADKWGSVFTGYAPIRNSSDVVVGLLAIDMSAEDLYVPTLNVFLPVLLFVTVLVGVVCYRKRGFIKTQIQEKIRWKNIRAIMYVILFIAMIVYWAMFATHFYMKKLRQEEVGIRLMAIAATAASQFDPKDLEKLRFARDMSTEEYQRVFKKLNEIREVNPEIKWLYVIRPTSINGLWEYIVDADSNYFLGAVDDLNADNILTPDEENVWTGRRYYSEWGVFHDALDGPAYTKKAETDQWGTFITGAAPIKRDGITIGILGIDFSVENL